MIWQEWFRDQFLSTPSARRATGARTSEIQLFFEFLSTPSARRATRLRLVLLLRLLYFYPRPPRGGRRLRVMSSLGTWLFLSTPSARRAT